MYNDAFYISINVYTYDIWSTKLQTNVCAGFILLELLYIQKDI